MIRLLFYALIILALAVYIALIAKQDPGYALLSRGNWSVEGTLVLLMGVLTLVITVILIVIYLIIKTIHLPSQLARWNKHRKTDNAVKDSNRGFIELAEGNWLEAEKHLNKSADSSVTPVLNYLAAAEAAQENGAQQRRDHYLLQAHASDSQADIAIGLTQAKLQLKDGQAEQALATLMHLQNLVPRHKQVLKMLVKVYQQLNSWEDMARLLPELHKSQIVEPQVLSRFEQSLNKQLMKQSLVAGDLDGIKQLWKKMPKIMRNEASMIHFYSQLLIAMGEQHQAITLIREGLNHDLYPPLVELYGQVSEPDIGKQLKTAEAWLEPQHRTAELLLTLGRLSVKNELWGKSRDYFKESIQMKPTAEACKELAELYEKHLDNPLKAMKFYREGLLLSRRPKELALWSEGNDKPRALLA
jgi:HemY protein